MKIHWLRTTCLISGVALFFATPLLYAPFADANPQGGNVSAGSAAITQSGNTLDVTQSTNKAVIDWQSFNIAPNETTQFIQPSSSSITLNRVNNATGPSQILGTLTANGNIVIVNADGILFGKNATVDVNSLVATSANISNSNFMSGGPLQFNQPGSPTATITNEGQITAQEAGLVGLVAPNVINSGIINAKLGKVQLASGDSFTLDLYGDGLMNVKVSDAVQSQLVANSGTINAAGGTIALTAAAGRKIVNSLITVSGELNAPAAEQKNGKIIIYAEGSNAVRHNVASRKGKKSGTSTVLVSGLLNASGYSSGQTGGSISVLGDDVGILSGAIIDASGFSGGGTIQIGGDFHGAGTTPTALNTVVENGALILANAVTSGNGGNVAVWSDNTTQFYGNIEAMGGALSGNGGFVETSGKQNLAMSGMVDASAPNGNAGTWLMDPNNVTISNTATTDMGSSPDWSDTGSPANVDVTDIEAALNLGTSVDITSSGNIAVNNSILENTWNGTVGLTLAAATDITLASNVGITASGNSILNVTLDSNTGGLGGAIVMNSGSSIVTNGGNIVMGGNEAIPSNIVAGTGYAVGDLANVNGIYGNGTTVNASGGNIIMNGTGYTASGSSVYLDGINLVGASVIETSGTGRITLNGIGGQNGGSGDNEGIVMSGATIETIGTAPSGTISLTGTGGYNSGGNNYGIEICCNGSNSITTTGSSPIMLTGIAGTGGSDTGLYAAASSGTNPIGGASDTGNITFTFDTIGGLSSTPIQTTGTVTFQPYTPNTAVNFANGTSGLAITQAIMDEINAPTVTIGAVGDTGALTTGAFNWEHTLTALNLIGDGVTIGGNITKGVDDGSVANTANGTLTVESNTNITLNSSDAISSSSTYGALNTIFDSDTGGGSGYISIAGSILSNGGNIVMGGNEAIPSNIVAGTGYAVGGSTSSAQYGINIGSGAVLNASAASCPTGGCNIIMNGQGGSYTNNNDGIYMNGGTIETSGTASGTGTISITGTTGSIGNADDSGIYMPGGTIETTGTGLISLSGTGGGASNTDNYGIYMTGGSIAPTGAAPITLTGTAGYGTLYGIDLNPASATTLITSGGGAVTLASPTSISLTNTTITYASSDYFNAVLDSDTSNTTGYIYLLSSTISTNGGNIYLGGGALNGGIPSSAATGTSNSAQQYGIIIGSGAVLNASATTSCPSGGCNITLDGQGGAISTGNNFGIDMGAGTIETSGGGTGIGTINITGTGGAASSGGDGIFMSSGTIETTGTGAIDLTGYGGGASGTTNYGIYMSGGSIAPTGAAPINLTGTAGYGTAYGIDLAPGSATTLITSAGGTVTLQSPTTGGATSGINLSKTTITYAASDLYNILFQADSLAFATTSINTNGGTATFEPYTTGNTLAINVDTGSTGLQITSGILNDITATGGIIIGSTNDADALNVGPYAWSAPVTFNDSTGNINITNGSGALSFTNALNANTTTGNVTLSATTNIVASGGGTITTQGGNIVLDSDSAGGTSGYISLSGTTAYNTNGGNIYLGGNTLNSGVPSGAAVGGSTSTNTPGINIGSGVTLNASAVSCPANGCNITLDGQGGVYTSGNNSGIVMSGGTIETSGTASGTGTITLTGQAGSIYTTDYGIFMSGGTIETTGTGLISLSGTGGGASSNNNYGIYMTGGSIAPTGAAPITLTGTAGFGTLYGIYLNPGSATTLITSGGGTVTLASPTSINLNEAGITYASSDYFNAILDADTSNTSGFIALTNSTISTNGGNINLGGGALVSGVPGSAATGTSSSGTQYGIVIEAGDTINASAASACPTGGCNITLDGQGGGYTSGNDGIYMLGSGSMIETSGTASGTGVITLTGTGGSTGSADYGIGITNGTIETTGTGAIGLTGYGGGASGSTNYGIYMTGGSIAPTGAAPINLTGTAGFGTIYGINLAPVSATTLITSAGGTVTLASPTGITLNEAGITYASGDYFNAVLDADTSNTSGLITLANATISTNGGNINLGGGALISGVPSSAATGTSSNGTEYGIYLPSATLNASAATTCPTGGCNITLDGQGGSYASGSDYGIYMTGGTIETSGGGTGIGVISLTGTGSTASTGTGSDNGIYITSGTIETSGTGAIGLTGYGGGIANANNYGIEMTGGSIAPTGAAPITLTGTAGFGTAYGIDLSPSSATTLITSGGGMVTLSSPTTGGATSGINLKKTTITYAASDVYNILFQADSLTFATTSINTDGGTATFEPYTTTNAVPINVYNGSGGLQITNAILNDTTATGGIIIGNSADANPMTVGPYSWGSTPLTLNSGSGNISMTNGSGGLYLSNNLTVNTGSGNVAFTTTTDIEMTGTTNITTGVGGGTGGSITFDANSGNGGAGGILIEAGTIASNGGAITLGGTATPQTGYAIGDADDELGIELLDGTIINAGGGAIIMNGQGWAAGTNTASATGIGIYGNAQVLTSGTGTITLTGLGAGTGTGSYNDGIDIEGASTLVSAQNGAISITGTGGSNAESVENDGVALSTGATITSTGTGGITITGILGNGQFVDGIATYAPADGLAATVGGNSMTSNITLISDYICCTNGYDVFKTSGNITVEPYTPSTPIGLAGASGSLTLNATQLGFFSAGSLTFGSTSDTGPMTLGAYSGWTTPVSFITGNSGSITVSGAQVATGSGSFTFTGPTTLDANLTTASQNITFNSAVLLGANETINAGTGSSAVDFASTVDSGSGGPYTLTVDAGTGGITAGGAMGGISALGATSFTTTGGASTFGNLTTGSGLITFDTGGTTAASGVISNTGGVTMSGAGTLTLSGTNTYTGPTTIDSGIVSVGTIGNGGVAGNLGEASTAAANLVLGGGTLEYTGSTASTNRNFTLTTGTDSAIDVVSGTTLTISGASTNTTGALTKVDSGTLALTGANLYNGGTNIDGGILNFKSGSLGSSGNITFGGGELQYASGNTQDISARLLNSTSPILIDNVNNNVSFGSIIGTSNTGGLTLNSTGTGILILSNANTFTGGLTIDSGTVEGVNNASAFGAGNITLGNSAGGSSNATLGGSGSATFANPIVLASNTTGTLTIETFNTTTFSGGVTGNNNFTISSTSSGFSPITFSTGSINNAGTITDSSPSTGGVAITAAVGSNVTGIIENSATDALTASGGLAVNSGGTTLTNNNSSGSALLTVSGNVTGTGNLILDNNSSITNGITLSGTSVNNTGMVTNSGTGSGNSLISAIIGTNVTGVIENSSTSPLTLSGANTFTGGLTIDSGTVVGNNSDAFGGSGTGTVTIGNSAGGTSNATLEPSGVYGTSYANPIVLASNTTGTLAIANGNQVSLTGGVTGTNNLTLENNNTSDVGLVFSTGSINNAGTVTNSGTGAGSNTGVTIDSVVGSNVTGVIENSASTLLYLENSNTFTGGTTILSGEAIGGTNTAFSTGNITLGNSAGGSNNATLGSGSFLTIANPIVLASTTTGTLTITNGSESTFTGGVTGNNNLTINDIQPSPYGITFSTGSINNAGTVTNSGTGAASVTINSVIGTNVTGVIENGTSPLILSGANTYTGPTTITSGTIETTAANVLGGASSTSALVMGGGTLNLDGHNEAVGSLTGTGSITSIAAGTFGLTVGYDNTSPATYSGTYLVGSSTADSLTKVGTGTLTLSGANTYNGTTTVSAGTLSLGANNALPSSSVVTVASSGTFNLNSYNDTVSSLTNNGAVTFGTGNTLTTSGAQTYTGTVTGDGISLVSTGGGAITAANALNDLTGNISVTTTNAASIATADGLSLGTVSAGTFLAQALDGNLTLNGQVQVTGTSGNPLVLSASADFINNFGATALQTGSGGRWLVFSAAPGGDTFGNLNSGNTAVWDTTYGGTITQTGDRYVFAYQPTLDFTSQNIGKVYGTDDTAAVAADYTVSGVQAGVANAYLGDTNATAFSGAPGVTSSGSTALAQVLGGPYAVTVAQGTLAASDGYALGSYTSSGVLTITPATLTGAITANNKVYDGTTAALAYLTSETLSGTTYGTDASNLSLSVTAANFNTKDVLTANTVTATGLSLTGSAASDYQLSSTSAATTAYITPATLTVAGSFTAGNKLYDGTTAATITSNNLSLIGILNTDSVSLNPVAAFANANVGTGKTVNLTGGSSLSGSAFSDYDLSLAGAPMTTANITSTTPPVTPPPAPPPAATVVTIPSTVVWTSQNLSQPNLNATISVGSVVLIPSGAGTFIPVIGGTIFVPPSQNPTSNTEQTEILGSVSNAAFEPSAEEIIFDLPPPDTNDNNSKTHLRSGAPWRITHNSPGYLWGETPALLLAGTPQ